MSTLEDKKEKSRQANPHPPHSMRFSGAKGNVSPQNEWIPQSIRRSCPTSKKSRVLRSDRISKFSEIFSSFLSLPRQIFETQAHTVRQENPRSFSHILRTVTKNNERISVFVPFFHTKREEKQDCFFYFVYITTQIFNFTQKNGINHPSNAESGRYFHILPFLVKNSHFRRSQSILSRHTDTLKDT